MERAITSTGLERPYYCRMFRYKETVNNKFTICFYNLPMCLCFSTQSGSRNCPLSVTFGQLDDEQATQPEWSTDIKATGTSRDEIISTVTRIYVCKSVPIGYICAR